MPSIEEEHEIMRQTLSSLMDEIAAENEKIHAEMQDTRRETTLVIEKIMTIHNANMKDFEKKIETKLRGMAYRLESTERSIDDLRKSIKSISDGGGGQSSTTSDSRSVHTSLSRQQQKMDHHETLFSKHKEAIQKVYLEVKSIQDKVELINRKEEIRNDLYGSGHSGGMIEPISSMQIKIDQMKKEMDNLKASTESILVMNTSHRLGGHIQPSTAAAASSSHKAFQDIVTDDNSLYVERVISSLQDDFAHLKSKFEEHSTRHAEDIELIYKTIESSSHLHTQQQQQHDLMTEKLLSTNSNYEASIKEFAKHMQQRDRQFRDLIDRCGMSEQNIDNMREAIQILSKELSKHQ